MKLNKVIMRKFILLIISLFICMSLNATNNSIEHTSVSSSTYWYITTDCFAATTTSAFDEMTKACNRKDQNALMRMVQNGYVAVLSKGTSVDMIKYGFAQCRIKVLSGSYRGSYLYIASEFVDSK